jgi:hypothetical protein
MLCVFAVSGRTSLRWVSFFVCVCVCVFVFVSLRIVPYLLILDSFPSLGEFFIDSISCIVYCAML